MTIQETFQLALEHHRAGRLPRAEALYRAILLQDHDEVNALHGLAFLAHQTGRSEEGLRLLRRAIMIAPRFAQFHFSLAEILHSLGRDEEAVAALQATVQLEPSHAAAYLNLGLLQHNLRRPQESLGSCRRAIELDPKNADAHNQLACAYLALNRTAEAARASQAALQLQPNHARAGNNLGEALRAMDRPDEAAMHYQRALDANSGEPQIMHNNLGIARMMQGRVDEAIVHYRRAIELQSDYASAASNLLYTLHYSPSSTAETLAAEHASWAQSFQPRVAPLRKHRNVRDLNRPLRIGYVSSDFRKHAVEHFIEPILANHDHAHFEITGYSSSPLVDESTHRLRSYCNHWREIHSMSDTAAADLIAKECIDILIDLSVHSAGNRLLLFAQKPAPLQMTYLGYPGTTGLSTIDYRITAAGLDLPGLNEGPEQLLVLPHSYFCYQPPRKSPAVADPPSQTNGFITFGSCNRLSKINDRVIATWAKLLHAMPDAKLQLLAVGLGEPATRRRFVESFAAHDIPIERLILEASRDEAGYLAAHHRVDIMLDPFPFNGGTTTLHALWMGVPTVTLAGRLPVGRMGLNILTTIGLSELVAHATDDYVEKAAELAQTPARLADLRRGMRSRLNQSPLMNARTFVKDLEQLYRDAWKRLCE